MIAGLGARGGAHQINPTDFTICLPLGLMTVLAFHTQPDGLDQICSIDLGGGAPGVEAEWTNMSRSAVYITQRRHTGIQIHLKASSKAVMKF